VSIQVLTPKDSLGSSVGAKKFLESADFKRFTEQNPQIEFNLINRTSRHPFIQSEYVNGYRKDVGLRNEDDIMARLIALRNSGFDAN
jgi:hypothetical protein